jgi:hypothetical protein
MYINFHFIPQNSVTNLIFKLIFLLNKNRSLMNKHQVPPITLTENIPTSYDDKNSLKLVDS